MPTWRTIYAPQAQHRVHCPTALPIKHGNKALRSREKAVGRLDPRLYSELTRPFSKLLEMCAMLFPVWKQSLTSFLIILALQNYQCSRLDVDWAAKQKMMRAGWIARLYSKITRPFSVQNSPKLLEMSAMFFFSFFQIQFHVLPENCSCPKLLDLPT